MRNNRRDEDDKLMAARTTAIHPTITSISQIRAPTARARISATPANRTGGPDPSGHRALAEQDVTAPNPRISNTPGTSRVANTAVKAERP